MSDQLLPCDVINRSIASYSSECLLAPVQPASTRSFKSSLLPSFPPSQTKKSFPRSNCQSTLDQELPLILRAKAKSNPFLVSLNYHQHASHIFHETVASANCKSIDSRSQYSLVLSQASIKLLTVLRRPRSFRTLLHHNPAQSPDDSSERVVLVSTSIYHVDQAQEKHTRVTHGIVALRMYCAPSSK